MKKNLSKNISGNINVTAILMAFFVTSSCSGITDLNPTRETGCGSIRLEICTDGTETKAFHTTDIADYSVLIGPYDKESGTYGEPERIAHGLTHYYLSSYTFIGISEGEKYIAIMANPKEKKNFSSLSELLCRRWTLKEIAEAGVSPKFGIEHITVKNDEEAEVTVVLRQCISSVFIRKLDIDNASFSNRVPSRHIYIRNVYLQNVPIYNDRYYFCTEDDCPPTSDEEGWINTSDITTLTQDAALAALTIKGTNATYTHGMTSVHLYSMPNLTDRHTKLVINAAESVYDPDYNTGYVDTYYTIDLPVLCPNQRYNINSILITGSGARSPEEYAGPGALTYEMEIPDQWREGPCIEENL